MSAVLVSLLSGAVVAATPVTPQPWFEFKDYPMKAFEKSLQGVTQFELLLSPDGKIADCRVTESVPHVVRLLRRRTKALAQVLLAILSLMLMATAASICSTLTGRFSSAFRMPPRILCSSNGSRVPSDFTILGISSSAVS